MEKETTVILRDLTTGYRIKKNNKVISSNLNAQLHAGELTCMLGPNGAGKSTLLRTLAAFQPALSGEIIIDNVSLQKYSPRDLSKQVSVVLTNNSNIRNMTAEEVVAIGRSPYTGFWGRLRERDRKTIEKCMEWVEIGHLRHRQMQTLSDGERQKVMIAKAIAQETPIILLDEPTAFLDYPSKVSTMLMLHRLAKALKKTIFMSTHDLEHALQVADQIWLIDKENGLTSGIPEDLCAEGQIERYFLRPGLTFERTTCSFGIEHEVAREVLFEGNPDHLDYQLAARAFIRNAIRPIRHLQEAQFEGTRADVVIRIPGDGTYRVIDKGEEAICANRIEHIISITNSTLIKNQIQSVREAANMTAFE